jgi:hypothetical protein
MKIRLCGADSWCELPKITQALVKSMNYVRFTSFKVLLGGPGVLAINEFGFCVQVL